MELDAVLVEVVEDAQAPLVPFPVVRLGPARSSKLYDMKYVISSLILSLQFSHS